MNNSSIISFIRICREYPDLKYDRKKFGKVVNKLGDEAYKVQKNKIHQQISNQKHEIMRCFDIYNDYVSEHKDELLGSDNMDDIIEKIMNKFLNDKEEE